MSDEFKGPIIDVRFVIQNDKRIMQITRDGRTWETPPTVIFADQPPAEGASNG